MPRALIAHIANNWVPSARRIRCRVRVAYLRIRNRDVTVLVVPDDTRVMNLQQDHRRRPLELGQ